MFFLCVVSVSSHLPCLRRPCYKAGYYYYYYKQVLIEVPNVLLGCSRYDGFDCLESQASPGRLIRCEIEDVPRIFRRFTATNTIRCAGSAAKNRT